MGSFSIFNSSFFCPVKIELFQKVRDNTDMASPLEAMSKPAPDSAVFSQFLSLLLLFFFSFLSIG